MRFVPLPFRAEGGCSPGRLPLFAGALLRRGRSSAGPPGARTVLYLILLFPLAVGLILAAVGTSPVAGAG